MKMAWMHFDLLGAWSAGGKQLPGIIMSGLIMNQVRSDRFNMQSSGIFQVVGQSWKIEAQYVTIVKKHLRASQTRLEAYIP